MENILKPTLNDAIRWHLKQTGQNKEAVFLFNKIVNFFNTKDEVTVMNNWLAKELNQCRTTIIRWWQALVNIGIIKKDIDLFATNSSKRIITLCKDQIQIILQNYEIWRNKIHNKTTFIPEAISTKEVSDNKKAVISNFFEKLSESNNADYKQITNDYIEQKFSKLPSSQQSKFYPSAEKYWFYWCKTNLKENEVITQLSDYLQKELKDYKLDQSINDYIQIFINNHLTGGDFLKKSTRWLPLAKTFIINITKNIEKTTTNKPATDQTKLNRLLSEYKDDLIRIKQIHETKHYNKLNQENNFSEVLNKALANNKFVSKNLFAVEWIEKRPDDDNMKKIIVMNYWKYKNLIPKFKDPKFKEWLKNR